MTRRLPHIANLPEITFQEARQIADIDYPANPRGIGAPLASGPYMRADGRVRTFDSVHLDALGRGVWLVSRDGLRVPCPRRS